MSYSIYVFFRLRNISVERVSTLIKRFKEVSNKIVFRETFPDLNLSNITDNDKRILDFIGKKFYLRMRDMSSKNMYKLADCMEELAKKISFIGGDLKWVEKLNKLTIQGMLKKEILTKKNIEKYVDYFNQNQELLNIEELNLAELRELVKKLRKLNNKFILKRISEDIIVLSEKDISYCAEKFIDPVTSGSLKFGDYLIHLITKRGGYGGYKFVKPGEVYFGIAVSEHYFRSIESNPDHKKNTKEFLKVLKIIYETLKPEYGWGGNELDVEGRSFDINDYWWFITIYGPEIVERIGRKKFETLPVRKKIKCSDGGYILLLDYYLEYTLEKKEKIKKHLFG